MDSDLSPRRALAALTPDDQSSNLTHAELREKLDRITRQAMPRLP